MPNFKRDGVELHYELDGSGPPTVIITGFSGHSNDNGIKALRAALSKQYTVLTVDNRGAGQTIVGETADVTMEDMADDIAAVMDNLHMDTAHVLGHSMGGCIAMTLALRHPGKVCSQVVAVSAACFSSSYRDAFIDETAAMLREAGVSGEILNRFDAIARFGEDDFRDPAVLDAWYSGPPDPFAQTPAGAEKQYGAVVRYDIRSQLPHIRIPTLVISAVDDLTVPPRFQDEIAAGIPGAILKRYPGAGHISMFLPGRFDAFVRDVVEFWEEHA